MLWLEYMTVSELISPMALGKSLYHCVSDCFPLFKMSFPLKDKQSLAFKFFFFSLFRLLCYERIKYCILELQSHLKS